MENIKSDQPQDSYRQRILGLRNGPVLQRVAGSLDVISEVYGACSRNSYGIHILLTRHIANQRNPGNKYSRD